MIRSMTAFARQAYSVEKGELVWELRSVNHRYLELSIRLPDIFRTLEMSLRQQASAWLQRGKVECTLRYQSGPTTSSEVRVDRGLCQQLLKTAEEQSKILTAPVAIDVFQALRWPGVVQIEASENKVLHQQICSEFNQALEQLVTERTKEGQQLQAFLLNKLDIMQGYLQVVNKNSPMLQAKLRQRLTEKLSEIEQQVHAERFEQEVLFYLQRADIEEELTRLAVHVEAFRHALSSTESIGRRLDFLLQEMQREANTIASKAADSSVSQVAVDMKVTIEQMREQVQNIE